MPHQGRGHLAVDADGKVLDAGAVYYGGILMAGSGGTATVIIYDGIDTDGDVIDYFSAAASGRDPRWLNEGIILRRGLYVDLGSNVDAFTLYYAPEPA